VRTAIDLRDGDPPLSLEGLAAGEWREVSARETARLRRLRDRCAETRLSRGRP
jgi:23S rRNA pseudouridine2457 synthase